MSPTNPISDGRTVMPEDLTDTDIRDLLHQYRTKYAEQKAIEAQAAAKKKEIEAIQKQLAPVFVGDLKTLETDGFQLTRSTPESISYDTHRAIASSPAIEAMLEPFRVITIDYDVKQAFAARPELADVLAPFRTVTTGTPRFTATLKKP